MPVETTPETEDRTYSAEEFAALEKDRDKWKALSRKNQSNAADNLKRAETAEADRETEIAAARAEAADEVRAEYGPKLVHAAFRAAASGRDIKLDRVLENIDIARFLKDGEADDAAIQALVDDISPAPQQTPETGSTGGLFQGARGATPGGAMPLNGDPILQRVTQMLGIQQ